ncbi:acetylxylan esterase [Kaarinaea lacus]
MTLSASVKDICPSLTRTDDFLPFWTETLDQLESLPVEISVSEKEETDDGLLLQKVTYQSLDNAVVHGYLLSPPDNAGPLIVYTHGYMGQCEVVWSWARQGASVFGIDIRGFGKSRNAVSQLSPHGYILTGIESEQSSILRGAVCDYIRGIQVANELLTENQQATVLYGKSFGGALAAMAAALTHSADLLVAAVPTFAWAEGRRKLVSQGSGAEINTYLKMFPEKEQQVMQVLSYFDTMNFAPLIESDAVIGVGLEDAVVPAETVYAFINHLSCHKEIREYPVSHTSLPEESLWDGFEDEWLRLAFSIQKSSGIS